MNSKLLFLPLASGVFATSAVAQTAAPTAVPAPGAAAPAPGTATGGTPAAPTRPQPAPAPFATFGGFSFTGYLRSRIENYDFFEAAGPNAVSGDGQYTFTGHQLRIAAVKSTPRFDLQFDLQQQLLTGLPNDAFFRPNPTTAVPLGQGGNYFAANGNQDGALNVKQAFVRLKNAVGTGSSARLGRFEFGDGLETVAPNPTLNFLKTQRISQRLIGTFAFTHIGRAFDGVQLSAPVAGGNFTGVAARPTEGVFQLNANDNIDAVDFLYGAYTKPVKNGDARIFGLIHRDGREAPKSVKTDNRPLAARQADDDEIQVYTLGANFIKTINQFDVLAWGALQGGKWGTLDHSANAVALEAGYQPANVRLRPWVRLGYYRGSGDGNPADGKHGTFFTPLPTPRLYARFPFFNQMNLDDKFAQLILRPNAKANLRFEAHALDLANRNDLLYFGGGAFQDTGFGIGGRPSGGSKKLATLLDVSLDYTFNPKTSLGLYYGYASGGRVIETTFANKKRGSLAFVEFTRRF